MKTRIVIRITLFLTVLFCVSNRYAATENDLTNNASLTKAKALVMQLDIITATDHPKFAKAEKEFFAKKSNTL
jgi:hypothetical protein